MTGKGTCRSLCGDFVRYSCSLIKPTLPLASLFHPHRSGSEAHMRGLSAGRGINVSDVGCERGILGER
jgi:hypothetical protein